MFCPACGKKIPDDSSFCPLCGATTIPRTGRKPETTYAPPASPPPPPPPPAGPPPPPGQAYPSPAGGILGIAFAILFAILALLWQYEADLIQFLLVLAAGVLTIASYGFQGSVRRGLGLGSLVLGVIALVRLGLDGLVVQTISPGNIQYYPAELDTPFFIIALAGTLGLVILAGRQVRAQRGEMPPTRMARGAAGGGVVALVVALAVIAVLTPVILSYNPLTPIFTLPGSEPSDTFLPGFGTTSPPGDTYEPLATTGRTTIPTRTQASPPPATLRATTVPTGGADGGIVYTGRSPDADFSATTVSGTAPLTVRFTDLSTGSPTTWVWDFGDGMISADQDPVHTYRQPGTYTVTMKAIGSGGSGSERKPDYIQVRSVAMATITTVVTTAPVTTAPPSAPTTVPPALRYLEPDWSIVPVSGPAPLTVQFTDLSVGTPTNWHWVFGDGTSSDEKNPVHTYTVPGIYAVMYSVGTDWELYGMGQIGTVTVTSPATPAGTAACSSYSYVINGKTVSGSCCGVLSSSIECSGGTCAPVYTCDGLRIS